VISFSLLLVIHNHTDNNDSPGGENMFKRALIIAVCSFIAVTSVARDVDGLIKKKSMHSVSVTLDRLESLLKKKGITVAMRWKHSEKAAGVNIKMRDTELLVFGNPKLGSHLMTSKQTAAIDLPMKAIAWKDDKGQVWIAYNDPMYIARRHAIDDRPEQLKKMSGALDKLTSKAASK
jgi:uncharacterized protein (DUF302 family)